MRIGWQDPSRCPTRQVHQELQPLGADRIFNDREGHDVLVERLRLRIGQRTEHRQRLGSQLSTVTLPLTCSSPGTRPFNDIRCDPDRTKYDEGNDKDNIDDLRCGHATTIGEPSPFNAPSSAGSQPNCQGADASAS